MDKEKLFDGDLVHIFGGVYSKMYSKQEQHVAEVICIETVVANIGTLRERILQRFRALPISTVWYFPDKRYFEKIGEKL